MDAGSAASSTTSKTEAEWIALTVEKNDPEPKAVYKDGEALFQAKYAAEFYATNPTKRGVKFSELKRTCRDPIITKVAQEFKDENAVYKARVAEWEKRWPELAQIQRIDRDRESLARRMRKQKAEEKRRETTNPSPKRVRAPHSDDPEFMEKANEVVGKLLNMQSVNVDLIRMLADKVSWLASYRHKIENEKRRLLDSENL